jgi:nucleoside 2-deoxyribosyltransferase
MATCPICKWTSESLTPKSTDPLEQNISYNCKRCGSFIISDILEESLKKEKPNLLLSAWLRDFNENGIKPPLLIEENIDEINTILPKYNPSEKQLRLLRNIEKRTQYPGYEVLLDRNNDYPLAWASSEAEFEFYLKSLVERGLIDIPTMETSVVITSTGWEYLEQNFLDLENKTQAFVAMSFSAEMMSAWKNAIEPAITEAGYKAYRIDVEPHNERIDTKIMAEIKNSRFVIADVTEQKQGVYFEAGYAIGLGLPVIWCVKKNELKEVHFDTRQYNHIAWNNELELKEKLYDFICAIIGKRTTRKQK